MQRQLKILETLIHCSLRIWPVCRKETSFTFRQTEIEYEWKTHIKERWWSNWTLKCSKTTLLQTFKSLVINLFALSNRIEHISLPLCAVYVNSEPVQQSFPIKLTTFYLLSVLSKKLYCQVTLLSVSFKPRGKNVQGESAAREPNFVPICSIHLQDSCCSHPYSFEQKGNRNASQARRYHTQSSNKNIRQGDIW